MHFRPGDRIEIAYEPTRRSLLFFPLYFLLLSPVGMALGGGAIVVWGLHLGGDLDAVAPIHFVGAGAATTLVLAIGVSLTYLRKAGEHRWIDWHEGRACVTAKQRTELDLPLHFITEVELRGVYRHSGRTQRSAYYQLLLHTADGVSSGPCLFVEGVVSLFQSRQQLHERMLSLGQGIAAGLRLPFRDTGFPSDLPAR